MATADSLDAVPKEDPTAHEETVPPPSALRTGETSGGIDIQIESQVEVTERPPIQAGTRVGKYLLEEKIGAGGMAEVWRGRLKSEEFDRKFAIKFMAGDLLVDPKHARMFIHEARVAQNIPQHANVVSVLEFDRVPLNADLALAGRYYLVMEWVNGADLWHFVDRLKADGKTLPQKVALFITGEILKGLATIHSARDEHSQLLGLVHRDISPANVLMSYTGGVKISDFGVAVMDNGQATKSRRGKLAYFAPEVVRGKPQDQLSDQFAVGIVAWEMLAGRRLFRGNNDAEIVRLLDACDIPDTGRQLDPAFDRLIRTMLAARPTDRFPTADDALSALYEIPTYSADPRQLAELLLYLFPDPEQRLPPPATPPRALAQASGPLTDVGFPLPMEPSVSVVIDWRGKQITPVWLRPNSEFGEGGPRAWARRWKQMGIDRFDELPPEARGSATQKDIP